MIGRALRIALVGSALLAPVVIGPATVRADVIVFDPNNFLQNTLTALRELQQIENQVLMLQNQALALRGLGTTALPQLSSQSNTLLQLLTITNQLQNSIHNQAALFQQQYPAQFPNALSMLTQIQTSLTNIRSSAQDAFTTQVTVASAIQAHAQQTQKILATAEAAVGPTQAAQANAQLLAVISQQLSELTALLAAQSRLQTNESAARLESSQQSRQQWNQFWGITQ